MDTIKEFQILVRRKVPFLSNILLWTIVALAILVFLLYFAMLPTKHSSGEMATVYYILAIPDWLKKSSAIGLVGLIILTPVYISLRLSTPALLTIQNETILIEENRKSLTIQNDSVTKIFFNDLTDLLKQPKYKIEIALKYKYDKTIIFRLKYYIDADDVLTALSNITNADFLFHNTPLWTMFDKE